jgi:6-phosphogluconolactonase/glucosamine-6-phosphate isomerase/deaminase
LKEIIQKKPTATNYPAAHINTVKGNVDFFVDKTAASLL